MYGRCMHRPYPRPLAPKPLANEVPMVSAHLRCGAGVREQPRRGPLPRLLWRLEACFVRQRPMLLGNPHAQMRRPRRPPRFCGGEGRPSPFVGLQPAEEERQPGKAGQRRQRDERGDHRGVAAYRLQELSLSMPKRTFDVDDHAPDSYLRKRH